MNAQVEKKKKSSFPAQFWLVILFEFIERGSYYGMMSFISVYFVDVLHFPRESVGLLKGVITPLLYFLPILSGALADRFGYRRILMIAFSLLGTGYFLTSRTSTYGAVFASLVVMGFGAGCFKPLISGTIARLTDESNSTQGFGIFYWSINLGAFLFPLILVPFLKAMNPTYVILAAAICTASMLIPTAFLFKDPVRHDKAEKRNEAGLIQTMANAFEIIYSPVVLLYHEMRRSRLWRVISISLLTLGFILALYGYLRQKPVTAKFAGIGITRGSKSLIFEVNRNMLGQSSYSLEASGRDGRNPVLTLHKPDNLKSFSAELLGQLHGLNGFEEVSEEDVRDWISLSGKKITVEMVRNDNTPSFVIDRKDSMSFLISVNGKVPFDEYRDALLSSVHTYPVLAGLTLSDCQTLHASSGNRSFFFLFTVSLVIIALILSAMTSGTGTVKEKRPKTAALLVVLLPGVLLWILPGMAMIGRIISTVIYLTVSSLLLVNKSDAGRFENHAKYLLMIFLYSGFWVMYFQMFDSVLWYVQAYVDASSLNNTVNSILGKFGLDINWFFDVEHVTVINAGTIILLQLLVSRIVRNTRALPTMIAGIALGTIGMGILAISSHIWVFIAGITIFSLGEMTAHPKFFSYVGLIAPKENKAMYMGYLFLYGVFGSSIGGILGARLYVHFVDNLNMPRTLWLIFACIGVFTLIALGLYNRYLKPQGETK